jgi:DNA-binding NarL/FixJ family response regulator
VPIRVVLADDHPLVLRGICAVLAAERDFQVVAECSDGQHALDAIHAHQPDVAVLDLHMPGKTGLEVLREMKASAVHTRGVLLVSQIGDEELLEATRQNVAGVVLKEMAPGSWCNAPQGTRRRALIERTSAARAFGLPRRSSTRDLARLPTPRERSSRQDGGARPRNSVSPVPRHQRGHREDHLHAVREARGAQPRRLIACNERGIL